VRFKNSVHPGDTVVVEATLANRRGNIFFIDAKGFVDGKLCVSGVLSVALIDKN
jgi:3-hydroxyacyl-[acyl-carrier-protein] dehydratase